MSIRGKHILFVDDDKFLLDMYAVKFREAGAEVALAPSGAEALRILSGEESVPDAILLDIVMPEMSGLELLSKLHEDSRLSNTALIILSNQSQQSDVDEAKKIGVDGYIIKASTIPSEVLDAVDGILAKKHGN